MPVALISIVGFAIFAIRGSLRWRFKASDIVSRETLFTSRDRKEDAVNIRMIAVIALSAVTVLVIPCAIGVRAAWTAPAPPPVDAACTRAMNSATVDSVAKVGTQQPAISPQAPSKVSLSDTISVRVTGLAELQGACPPLVLYLNNYPVKSLRPFPPVAPPIAVPGGSPPPSPPPPPSSGELYFVLNVTDDSRSSWTPILGSPCCRARDLKVSVGIEDQYPLRSTTGKTLPVIELDILGNRWFFGWAVIFLAMLGLFIWCVRRTNIIRDGNPIVTAPEIAGTYSLARTQGALWFFVILAAYLLIGMVTGDFSNSINSTALILLGIGAGTVVGSALIDVSKDTQNAAQTKGAIVATQASLAQLDQGIASIDKQLQEVPPPSNDLNQERVKKEDEKTQVLSDYRKLTRQSEHFLTDIMSDANGVSFHRFQMATWTLVLSLVFIKGVYENLAMPEFNTTLMGLLGLSAGTYLGLKIPEASTPKK
jgi:hypothetical protein